MAQRATNTEHAFNSSSSDLNLHVHQSPEVVTDVLLTRFQAGCPVLERGPIGKKKIVRPNLSIGV